MNIIAEFFKKGNTYILGVASFKQQNFRYRQKLRVL